MMDQGNEGARQAMHNLSRDELRHVNELCRRYVDKGADECTGEDLERVHEAVRVELRFLTILRDEALHDIQQIVERAAERRRGREGR